MFAPAYVAQLNYGNHGFTSRSWIWHNLAHAGPAAALGGFVVGIWFAKIAVVAALT